MITAKVDNSRAMVKLAEVTPNIFRAVLRQMQAIGYDLQGYIQREKLQGQVLNHRSGNLSSHVLPKTEATQSEITTRVGVDSGAVPYAAIHEYGGTITTKRADYLTFATADGHWHRVKSVTMPERSYLRSGLNDKRSTYIEMISDAARKGAASPA